MPPNRDREKMEQMLRKAKGRGRVGGGGVSLGKGEYGGTETSRGLLEMPEGMTLAQIRDWKKARDEELARLEAKKGQA